MTTALQSLPTTSLVGLVSKSAGPGWAEAHAHRIDVGDPQEDTFKADQAEGVNDTVLLGRFV